jgi:hypothetical protein
LVWQSGTSLGGSQNVAIDNVRFSATGDLTQTIQWAQIPDQALSSDPILLNATASSGLPIAYEVVSGPATVSGNRLTLTGTGTVQITARQDGGGVYNPAPAVTQSFNVQRTAQVIQFVGPGTVEFYQSEAFSLNPTSSSGLPVTLTVESGPGFLVGSILSIQAPGTIVIAASQDGDSRFAPAVTVRQTVVVRPGSQTINFTAPEPQTYAKGKTVLLRATASSGLPVAFVVSAGPATISGNQLTLTGAGVVQVTASQPGNSSIAPAAPVTQVVQVSKGTQTITLTAPSSVVLGSGPLFQSDLFATSSSGLPVFFSVLEGPGGFDGPLVISGVGTIRIAADQAGNADFLPAERVVQSIVVLPGLSVQKTGSAVTGLWVTLEAGRSGTVEESLDLKTWTSIGTATGRNDGQPALVTLSPTSVGTAVRYWRVRVQP